MKKQHKQMLVELKNGIHDDSELAKLEEPEEVKTEEDKTILDAIDATEKQAPEEITPIQGNEQAAEQANEPQAKEEAQEPSGEEEKTDTSKSEGIPKGTSDFTEEIINSLTNTLLNLTQKNVEIKKQSEEVAALTKLSEQFDDKIIIGRTKLSDEIEAECAFLSDIKTASVISDLVLMGEGKTKDELTDDDIDALKEMLNQSFGSSVQQVLGLFGVKTFYDPVTLSVINAKEEKDKLTNLFEEDEIYAFDLSIKIDEILTSKLYFYLTSGIKEYLVSPKTQTEAPAEPSKIMKEGGGEIVTAESEIEQFAPTKQFSVEGDKADIRNVELIKSIEVDVKIKLGETIMPLKKIIKLTPGAIIELNKDVDSLLELVVNDKSIAQGVLVVVSSNNFGLRVTEILDKPSRIKGLGGIEI
jgi:flagellar motor switch protein FliN/FliY